MADRSASHAAPGPGVEPAPLARPSTAVALVRSLRPAQATKNLFVFAALVFAERLFVLPDLLRATAAFLVFCLLSGVVYLVNDVVDRDQDRRHPLKRLRPIAAGALTPAAALVSAAVLTVAALAAAAALAPRFAAVAVAYLALLSVYSLALKNMVILDVLAIAVGFVLRAVAGGVAVDVPISQWLLVCTILLALFLALSKRRHEIVLLAEEAAGHRPILGEYSPYLLDQMIGVVTASTIMSYILYATAPDTAERFGTPWLGLTIPLPLYGVFRYLYLVHQKGGGTPSDLLLTDRPLLLCVALWAAAVVGLIYF